MSAQFFQNYANCCHFEVNGTGGFFLLPPLVGERPGESGMQRNTLALARRPLSHEGRGKLRLRVAIYSGRQCAFAGMTPLK
jgi:hypothetical protein